MTAAARTRRSYRRECLKSVLRFLTPACSVFSGVYSDQTLDFAANARAPAAEGRLGSRDEYVKTMKAVLLAIFGLRGTVNTKVGGDYVRGISGGQRKRVSIAELMTTRARIACHDNSTRVGLVESACVPAYSDGDIHTNASLPHFRAWTLRLHSNTFKRFA